MPDESRVASRTLIASVAATGSSIAHASTVTSGHQAIAASAHTSVAERCHSVSDDSRSVRDRPR